MNKHFNVLLLSIALSFVVLFSSPAQAGWQPYAWLVTADIKAFPDQLSYTGSTLNPLVKAYIKYAQADGTNEGKYETLWFCRGKAFGLERVSPLSIQPGAGVGIKITFKSQTPGPSECRAAAQSILRLYLDLRLNNNAVQTVIVPDETFSNIIAALADEHFQIASIPLEVPTQIASSMFLQDESDRQTQHMCYAPGSFGY